MRKFNVVVSRIGYASRQIEVEAESEEQAKLKAIDEAGDYEFSEHDADYSVDAVTGTDSEQFPNGFISWKETYFEVVAHLMTTTDKKGSISQVAYENGGRGLLYSIALELTDEFEQLHKGEEWIDLDFFDTIDAFLKEKEWEHREENRG